ncbi:hypothetical protein H632_c569p2, partial [Helicosporidium sp. ATCC 50920]
MAAHLNVPTQSFLAAAPHRLRSDLEATFPGIKAKDMTIVCTCQRASMDLSGRGDAVEKEKDCLLEQFSDFAANVCTRLLDAGFWADYVDPCSGLPALDSLPTPIQNEVIPLVLGGGDVMAAAETGSGKTGAFALPLLQVCHEVKRGVMKGEAALSAPPPPPTRIQLDLSDRDASVAVAPDGASAQSRHESAWAGVRASHGFSRLLANSGPEAMQVADAAGPEPVSRVYYEVSVQDEGLVRVGWAAISAARELGTDALSFGFGGTGKKSHAGAFADYGRAYGRGDVVGVCLDWDRSEISFCVNGESLGVAFQGEEVARLTGADRSFFPAVALKNAEVCVNFGARPW